MKPNFLMIMMFLSISAPALGFEEGDEFTGETRTIEAPASAQGGFNREPEYLEEEAVDSTGEVLRVFKKPPSKLKKIQARVGLDISTRNFQPRASAIYPWKSYLDLAASVFYWNSNRNGMDSSGYGPELSGELFLPNKSIFRPYAGISAGLENWKQSYGEEINESSSAFHSYFFGIGVRLSKFFGIRLTRSSKQYAANVPLETKNEGDYQENPQMVSKISFVARF